MRILYYTINRRAALLIMATALLAGCSSTQVRYAWDQTKMASYSAITDPVTWGTALGGAVLYITDADDRITDYFADNHWVDNDLDDLLLDTNAAVALLTAVTVPQEDVGAKAKRAAVALGAFGLGRLTANGLEENVSKESPDGSDDALGSHHAVEPFAGAAVTRRNVSVMTLSPWAAYSIVGVSYTSASLAALTRVQEEGHSFGDQLVNASIGNFIGIFLTDAFMPDNGSVDVALTHNHVYIGFKIAF